MRVVKRLYIYAINAGLAGTILIPKDKKVSQKSQTHKE